MARIISIDGQEKCVHGVSFVLDCEQCRKEPGEGYVVTRAARGRLAKL